MTRLGGRPIRVSDQAALLEDGTLAGSTLTMDRAFRNIVTMFHASIARGGGHVFDDARTRARLDRVRRDRGRRMSRISSFSIARFACRERLSTEKKFIVRVEPRSASDRRYRASLNASRRSRHLLHRPQ